VMVGIDHLGSALPAYCGRRQQAGHTERGGTGEKMTPGYRRREPWRAASTAETMPNLPVIAMQQSIRHDAFIPSLILLGQA
jgi:hypothetical protein